MRSRSMAAALGTFALRTNQQSFFASSTPASTPLNQTDRNARDEVFLNVGAPSAPQRERADLTTRATSHLRNTKSPNKEPLVKLPGSAFRPHNVTRYTHSSCSSQPRRI